jgi:hypothetical protein
LTRRWRASRYGASLGLAVVGAVCGVVIPGTLGGTLATLLIGVGLVGVLSLVFYEIGLSEDHDRARRASRDSADRGPVAPERPDLPARRTPRRPERLRGQRRRLR